MSEKRRCHTIVYIGSVDLKDGRPTKPLRAVCDRPVGHSGSIHKGRLLLGQDVFGIIEWTLVPA